MKTTHWCILGIAFGSLLAPSSLWFFCWLCRDVDHTNWLVLPSVFSAIGTIGASFGLAYFCGVQLMDELEGSRK